MSEARLRLRKSPPAPTKIEELKEVLIKFGKDRGIGYDLTSNLKFDDINF